MTRTVVEVSSLNSGSPASQTLLRLYEPDGFPNADVFSTLDCSPDEPVFQALEQGLLANEAVLQAGKRLRDCLLGHVAVGPALQASLAGSGTANGEVHSIYLHLRSDYADQLPWETLCDQQGQFVALDEELALARMGGTLRSAPLERTFAPPIRVMAFLSAAGIPAQPQWEALYGAITASNVPTELRVFVAEPELAGLIRSTPAHPNVAVAVDFVPADLDFATIVRSADQAPHLMHFFCHGSTEDGPHLQLATIADWELGHSSIVVEPGDFKRLPGRDRHLWLVTLNCCLGAAPGEQEAQSFARTLVSEQNVPAVLGMREAISASDAHVFCAAFYQALLGHLARSLSAVDAAIEIEWARALYEPRRRLVLSHGNGTRLKAAASHKEWTLPTLYTQVQPFFLRRVSPRSELSERERLQKKAEYDTLQRLLPGLIASSTPTLALNEIRAQIARLAQELFATPQEPTP